MYVRMYVCVCMYVSIYLSSLYILTYLPSHTLNWYTTYRQKRAWYIFTNGTHPHEQHLGQKAEYHRRIRNPSMTRLVPDSCKGNRSHDSRRHGLVLPASEIFGVEATRCALFPLRLLLLRAVRHSHPCRCLCLNIDYRPCSAVFHVGAERGLLIRSTAVGHSHSFQVWSHHKCAAVNILTRVFWWTYMYIFIWCIPRREIAQFTYVWTSFAYSLSH